jgi:hypothetical protein
LSLSPRKLIPIATQEILVQANRAKQGLKTNEVSPRLNIDLQENFKPVSLDVSLLHPEKNGPAL